MWSFNKTKPRDRPLTEFMGLAVRPAGALGYLMIQKKRALTDAEMVAAFELSIKNEGYELSGREHDMLLFIVKCYLQTKAVDKVAAQMGQTNTITQTVAEDLLEEARQFIDHGLLAYRDENGKGFFD
jgi:hypothetical protein